MKFLTLFITISVLFLVSERANSQGINPRHLFNTGINMGHLVCNHKYNASSDQYGTWASNASAEWLTSWVRGSVQPISVSIDDPVSSHEEIGRDIQNMPTCNNEFYQSKLSIYRAGFHLSQAMVETGNSCSKCLQQEMQKAAIELRTISSITSKSTYTDLSTSLNVNASNLNTSYNEEMAKRQNQGMVELIKSIMNTIQNDLPDKLLICQGDQPQASVPQRVIEKSPVDKRKNRAFILKGGINNATLKGDQGTTTASKSGFHVGFDMYRGNPIFFVLGAKFFRNGTGEELMIPIPGQVVNADSYYIQGWVVGLGGGGYFHQNNDFSVSGLIKVNYIVSHSINGDLLSVGLTEVTDGAFSLEIGAGFSYNLLFVEFTFEPGLSEAVVSDGEKFKYNMSNISLGLKF